MVTVWAPASSANLGPGFDALGMALEFGCEVSLEEMESGLDIAVEGQGADEIPLDESNLVVRAATRVFERVRRGMGQGEARLARARVPKGLRLRTRNDIPIARGLGSSAAAIVAGLLAADRLTGAGLDPGELVALGTEMEGHPDNIAPALLGGITVAVSEQGRVYCEAIRPPAALYLALAVPEFQVVTEEARRLVPDRVSLEDAVHNLGRSSLLVATLASGRWNLLRVAMKDRLHQPYRRALVPGMEEAFRAAEEAGAAGVALSGSGPAVVALVPAGSGTAAPGIVTQSPSEKPSFGPTDEAVARASEVAEAMAGAFHARGVGCKAMVTRIARHGARVVQSKVLA